MTTYWCEPKAGSANSSSSTSYGGMDSQEFHTTSAIHQRLIDWNVDILTILLKNVVAHRNANDSAILAPAAKKRTLKSHPLDEVAEGMSALVPCGVWDWKRSPAVEIPPAASSQLRKYIGAIADLYRANAFHNFEHCSHVVMSTKKILDRMTEIGDQQLESGSVSKGLREMLSDPLTHFGVVFAALIHDVDHPGVSNAQLILERHPLVDKYSSRCMAEQNAVDVAWGLLMEPQFADLRECIFPTEREYKCFRQVVVQLVMATDLFDNDLRMMREARWDLSFGAKNVTSGDADRDEKHAADHRAAAAILEMVIQASDVSHTMQHFTVYRKWNMSLYTEMLDAFVNERSIKDPTEGWYEGELSFFDNYVIPLAIKLQACDVVGVSCDEFLDFANDNRMEWETKGRQIVLQASQNAAKAREQTDRGDSTTQV
jgi:3'5'-cyclic nucleotide phosphodiesterase